MSPPAVSLDAAPTSHVLRDVVVGALVLVVAASLTIFANLPTRTSVLAADQASMKDAVKSMDAKLDTILSRLPR